MGSTKQATGITKAVLTLKLWPNDVMNASFVKVEAMVKQAKSYDVSVESMVLYSMEFTLDLWDETTISRRGWQIGDEQNAQLLASFI